MSKHPIPLHAEKNLTGLPIALSKGRSTIMRRKSIVRSPNVRKRSQSSAEVSNARCLWHGSSASVFWRRSAGCRMATSPTGASRSLREQV